MKYRNLNVSILQMPLRSTEDNLTFIENAVEGLMNGYVRPELVIGVEYGIANEFVTIPGSVTERLSAIAKKHQIYLVPGTMCEAAPELGEDAFYNTSLVFGPDGNIIRKYRKKVPFRPGEPALPSGDDEYCIFEIPEKDITIGLLICYDQFFPEISRTLALEGAEMIICPAYDPMEFEHIPNIIPPARALENELFFIWTNGTGTDIYSGATCCGKSTIVNPEGKIIAQLGYESAIYTTTLDFNDVTKKRHYGTDQHLASLREFNVKYPYAGRLNEAPLYRNMPRLAHNPSEYLECTAEIGISNLGKRLEEN